MLRKWIVNNFVLDARIKLFGTLIVTPRASRVLFPLIVFVGLVNVSDPNWPTLQWFDWILLFILFIGMWLGFSFFNWSYFTLWPAKFHELDMEQRYDYLRGIDLGVVKNPELDNKYGNLTRSQVFLYVQLTELMKEKYKEDFVGLKNLLPGVGSICIIILWYNFIAPYLL